MPLSLEDPVVAIDARLAARKAGRSKTASEAHEVLAQAFGIETVGQLVHHYPRRYIDRSRVLAIGSLPIDAYVTVIATVRSVTKRQTRRHQTMVVVTIADGTGSLDLTFFNQPWIANWYKAGSELAVSGVVQLYRGRLQLANQEVEILRSDEQDLVHTGRITPVHPAADGITPRTIRELIWRAFERLPATDDPLPDDIRRGIVMHELGHAADLLYPAQIIVGRGSDLVVDDLAEPTRTRMASWKSRSHDEMERFADAIAERAFGVTIGYTGPCLLQSTARGTRPRPRGLR